MRLVYKYIYNGNKADTERILHYCEVSKNLYNQALYVVKQSLKENKFLFYNDIEKLMKETKNLEGEINYRLMPKAQSAQQCLKDLDKSLKSYFKSIKDWAKHKNKYKGKPRLPQYKKGYNQIILTSQCCQIKENFIYLQKDLKIFIPQWDTYGKKLMQFKQVRINPLRNGKVIEIEIIYESDITNANLDYNKCCSIDLGVDNLITMVSENEQPIIYNGKQIKSINQLFNKCLAEHKSKLDKCNKGKRTSNKIQELYEKRKNRISDLMHKVSRHIIRYMLSKEIGTIVVGYNRGWKDCIRIGKRNNQTFVQIPYKTLIDYLKYKCEMNGIKLIETDESYTSKCDALAMEAIERQEVYQGKRIRRGLYQSSVGKLINADVNGALNIMRKVFNDSAKRIIDRGLLFNPMKLNDLWHLPQVA